MVSIIVSFVSDRRVDRDSTVSGEEPVLVFRRVSCDIVSAVCLYIQVATPFLKRIKNSVRAKCQAE